MRVRTRIHGLLVFFTLLGLVGCGDAIVDPDELPPDFSPDVVGVWTGTYEGALGLIGTPGVVRDTFRLTFEVRRIGAEFAYEGEVHRAGAELQHLYDCDPAPLIVSNERHLQFDCVQSTQLDHTRLLRVEARADSAFQVMQGVVRDVLGAGGTEYAVELHLTVP